jgi:putative membrane protein
METGGSLNHSIDDAKKHYSSMFYLPSLKKALFIVAVLCLLVALSAYVVVPSRGFMLSLFLGISLFVLTLAADLIVSKLLLRRDPIYNLRRTTNLSLFSWTFWLVFIVIGVALSVSFGWLVWIKLCLLGFAAIVTLRIIVFIATTTAATWRRGLAVLLQPTLCLIVFLVFWAGISSGIPLKVLPFIVISPVIALIAGLLFFYPIERLGRKTYSVSSIIPLFSAFIVDWVADINSPIEKFFEDMGENADIEVSVLKFESSKPKAAIIVPLVHPGPFKNVGSSLLPSLMKHEFEEEFGCDACTPLGALGHERDLASQAQNHRIVSQVIASSNFQASSDLASPSVRVTEGAASTCCQIFGDTVFLCFTLAPKTTEDLPQELGRIVSEEAAKYGLKHAVVVNSHNSLTDIVDTEEHLDALRTAAYECLQKAVAQPTKQFMVGAASVFPKEFSLKAGMGPGGITAIVVQVQEQKTAYVVIDGNNMVSGFREKILAALGSAGFGESEVLTTDTHAVSAVVTGRRGYHPVGEVMDQEILIRYICDAAKKAEGNLEASNVGCLQLVVPKVRVIGEARLKSMTTLVDRAIQKIKQTLIPVFGLEGLILILLLVVL